MLFTLIAAGGLAASSSAFAAFPDPNDVQSTAATRLHEVAQDTQALPVAPAAIAPYCANTYTSGVEPLTLVKINDINNPSAAATGGTPHEDFTSIVGTLRPGATYAVTMKANTDGAFAHGFALYVDWNQDGLLTGANEGYWVGTVTGSTGTDALSATTYITVPSGAALGNTRMRAMTAFNTTTLSALPPCRTGTSYGQSEDYTVTIDPAAVVPALPLSLTASFTPTLGAVPANTTLAIAVANINASPTPITADFITILPAGMTLAADATTTCPGTFIGASGGDTITLASGASIPVGGCAISADVAVAAGGNYAVTAGPLTTAEGSGSAVAKFFGWNSTPSTSYNTGFEAPDYTVGAINSQQGWSARTSNVATTAPDNGAQHFSQTGLASPTTANNPLAISPTFPVGTTRYASVSANLRISHTTNGASWQFQPQDPGAGLLSTIVLFKNTGNAIQTYSWAGGSGTVVSTGATFTPNTYFNFKLIVDRATSNVRLCKDGVQIFESTDGTGTTGGNNIASMVFQQATGGGQTVNNTFFADDLNVSYTPSYNCDGSMPAHTVTPSVGTPSGTISPATAQTVNDGDTTSFTLAADAGFHIDTVGGTCGGALTGASYTTNPVTTDCTVVANFASDLSAPTVAKAFTPASVAVGANSTATITLTNPNASAITLSADLVDTLPAGLTASAASTTCGSGTASFTAGTLTLASGATIPASGSCTLTGTVKAAAA
ncbi:MAG: GEVED domain-containing protein, partial [Dokdonella sp.]